MKTETTTTIAAMKPAIRSWMNSGSEADEAVTTAMHPMLGFGASRADAEAAVAEAAADLLAEAAAYTARRKASAGTVAEFDDAWKAAAVMTTVQDSDGGTSREMRVPAGWNYEGCRTEIALRIQRGLR